MASVKGEARTATQARGLAFAAAAREVEAGAEMEAGRGWKRGVRTATAMAMPMLMRGQRMAAWPPLVVLDPFLYGGS